MQNWVNHCKTQVGLAATVRPINHGMSYNAFVDRALIKFVLLAG